MKAESGGMLVFVALALGAVLYGPGTPPPGNPNTSENKSASKTATTKGQAQAKGSGSSDSATPELACERTAYRLISEFFGEYPNEAPQQRRKMPDMMKLAEDRGYQLEFLLATLTDPIDSRVGWRFEPYLDSIQRAIEANHYGLDRFSLPWECALKEDKSEERKFLNYHERNPGVVLFRKADPDALLMLFLVGETPTTGIHKAAFSSALDSMLACEGWDRQVRVLGPASSGSALSLKLAIDAWYNSRGGLKNLDNLHFRIVSGSATTASNKDVLRSYRPRIDFNATVIPDNIALEKLKEYLHEKDPDAKVAVLTESNTGYGIGLRKDIRTGTQTTDIRTQTTDKPADSIRAPVATRNDSSKAATEPTEQPWLSLPFPMQISGVRSAYEKDPLLKTDPLAAPAGSSKPSRSTLDVPMEEGGSPRDVPAPLSPGMTSAAVELVLSNILSTISREGIDYVGLLATDTRDKLFLARQIRRHCPDVQIFTLESDLLYTHPSHSSYLEGMIVVSTYPLINSNQIWSDPERTNNLRLQLPDQGSQGVYNATLALLNYDSTGDPKKLEAFAITPRAVESLRSTVPGTTLDRLSSLGRGEFSVNRVAFRRRLRDWLWPDLQHFEEIFNAFRVPGPTLLEYEPPFESLQNDEPYSTTKPPVWLTVVGRGGLSPLKFYAQYEDEAGFLFPAKLPRRSSASLFLEASPQGYTWLAFVLFTLFSLFCLINCIGFWRVIDRSAQERSFFAILRSGNRTVDSRSRSHERHLWLLACFVTLTAVYAGLGLLGLTPPAARLTVDSTGGEDRSWIWLTIAWVPAFFWMLLVTDFAIVARLLNRKLTFFRWRAGDGKWAHSRLLPWNWRPTLILLALGSLLVSVWLTSFLISGESPLSRAPAILFYIRATRLTSGVSPVMPVVLIAGGLYLWCISQLKRLRLVEAAGAAIPVSSSDGQASLGIRALENRINYALEHPLKSLGKPLTFMLLLVLALPGWILVFRFLPTFECKSFNWLLLAALLLFYLLIAVAFLRFVTLWLNFRRLLRRLESHPMADAYDRLPSQFSKVIGNQFWARLPTVEEFDVAVQQLRILDDHHRELQKKTLEGSQELPALDEYRKSVDEHFAAEIRLITSENGRRFAPTGETQKQLLEAARGAAAGLESLWCKRTFEILEAKGDQSKNQKPPENQPTMKLYKLPFPEPVRVWAKLAEDFVAIQTVAFIGKVFVHLRSLLTFLTAGAFLMLMAVTSYPFQPHRLLTLFMWIVILSVAAVSVVVFVQAGRNEVLSRIAKTTPNQVTMDRWFVSGIMTYGILPLLALLVTQVPEISGVFSWIEPALKAFK